MIFVDTNILVRLATRDVPALADQAEQLLQECAPGEVAVTEAVLEECCFVLEFHASYRLPRQLVHDSLVTLLGWNVFSVPHEVSEALTMYGTHPKLDFVDCLLAVKARHQRARVLTFDKMLQSVLS